MSSDEARTARTARPTADLPDRTPGQTLAGLIDVLDRADGALVGRRSRTRRPAAHRPTGSRSGVRTVPLRSVQPAPMARPAPAPRPVPAVAVVAPVPRAGRLRAFARRMALWGAGPQGEYRAWRSTPPAPPATPRPSATVSPRRRNRAAELVRRVALWGAGPQGKYLAWSAAGSLRAAPLRRRGVDGPVVLREMPSTPIVQPAASSPAAVLRPRDPASSAGSRGMPPVPRGTVAVPGVRPGGPPERSRATGWPSPARPSPAATGLVRSRGDPLACPVRGSPLPARRARSPGSSWSSFP